MEKPKVTVLLATYNPDIDWLKEQLDSINSQNYDNIELVVCDDCSTTISCTSLRALIGQRITRFAWKMLRNETNLGSNKTFERLTMEASGDYFAYCDQDDIWEREKIELLISSIISNNGMLAYSDMSIIDGRSRHISDSITRVRKRFKYYQGKNIWKNILIRNFISGCSMLIRSDIAKQAIPFQTGMQHDRWLAINAAIKGPIVFVNKSLVKYRQHDYNQTGLLKGINDKESYIRIRLFEHLQLLKKIRSRFEGIDDVEQFMDDYIRQMEIRLDYAQGNGINIIKMIRYIKENKAPILFEIICLKLPDFIFKKIVKFIRKNNL